MFKCGRMFEDDTNGLSVTGGGGDQGGGLFLRKGSILKCGKWKKKIKGRGMKIGDYVMGLLGLKMKIGGGCIFVGLGGLEGKEMLMWGV